MSERSTTLFAYGSRLQPIRSGRFADAASALAWIGGAAATVGHPAGLAVAGVLLGIVATSVKRAVAAGVSFGITVAAGVVVLAVTGATPPAGGFTPVEMIGLALLGPPTAAAVVRALG
ncbi:hypothetical protein [Halolamina pelagica]|uniref:hypothetical protein n=1 Tax=Halolamina pelagica TaxID=699431 RepID=UPI0009450895|nr:hypothetical protein [Halolamina pelagica]